MPQVIFSSSESRLQECFKEPFEGGKTLNLISQQSITEQSDVTVCTTENKRKKMKAQDTNDTLITPFCSNQKKKEKMLCAADILHMLTTWLVVTEDYPWLSFRWPMEELRTNL